MLHTVENDAERACQRLAVASYSLMDQGRYEETAALFTEDAVWVRGGKPVAGKAAILASLNQRPATDISRHIVTNVLVELQSDNEGTARPASFRCAGPSARMEAWRRRRSPMSAI